jgi:virulence-associated protein VapD
MRTSLSLTVVFALCFAFTPSAHHSHGQYAETFTDIQGVVKELHFLAPHSWVYLEVKDAKGATQVWALEATSRAGLEKVGVTRDSIKLGDTVKVRCHPLRDGTNGCLLGFLKAPDGSVRNWDGGPTPNLTDF